MIDILNLALPYLGVIFIGFACGRAKGLPEAGPAWINFLLLHVSLPAIMFGIMSRIFLFTVVPLLIELSESEHPLIPHAFAVVLRQIALNPLIMSAVAGALTAALHLQLPVVVDGWRFPKPMNRSEPDDARTGSPPRASQGA